MTIGGDDFYYEPLLSSPVFDAPPASVHRGPLHPGACWEGVQRSGRNVYKVKVDISTVDLTEGKLSGMLQIRHLTPELESLVTFFEGEIIGDKTGFLTSRWGASEADDMKHWSRFPAFSKALRSSLVKPNLTFKQHSNRPFLFMRWKEQFVVPSSHAQNIHGASFAGFYYLCLDFDMPSDGAYAPPESARTSSPPLRGAARTRSMSSEISQATLGSARSSMLASPTQHATVFEDESADGIRSPSAHEARPPLPTPAPPAQPRRASNSGFSYASAVRGPTSSLQLSGTSTSHGTSSSISDIAMPKEVESTDTGVASASLGGSNSGATSNASSTSGLFTSMPPLLSTVPLPISIPTLIGTTSDDFPAPSSPPLGTHASFGALPTARHSGMTSPSMSSSTSGGSTVLGSRGIRNTIDSAVLVSEAGEGHSARQRSRSFNTASNRPDGPNERRSSMNRTSGSEKASMNWGYQSWMNCEIKGEPYQELSLRYVPKTRGTTQAFAFR
ncbi:BQ2448_2499 [Microbotryum intermedium]|uniref:BQ2448_2499 protein n=1 Tax=Microbotryum intermedium TaxID=269621 RepID=A0A238F9Q8_9BASI|nr:BQ2448_2499 [Microbotryum intermedium]